VGGERTDRTIVTRDSMLMMMECNSQDKEKERDEQEIGKFSVHQDRNLPICKEK
jgi:hypothetical protein